MHCGSIPGLAVPPLADGEFVKVEIDLTLRAHHEKTEAAGRELVCDQWLVESSEGMDVCQCRTSQFVI